MLTDRAGDYVEIQAGFGKTQYECISMPPKSVWSFSECYTLADIPADKLNASYDALVDAVKEQNESLGGCSIPYQLAYDKRNFEKAKQYCAHSFVFDNNAYNKHLYAHILYQLGDENSIYFAEKCMEINKESYCLAESVLLLLLKQQAYASVIRCFGKLADSLKNNPRLLMYLSMAYLKSGNAEKAEEILLADGGLVLLDFREGDKFLDKL